MDAVMRQVRARARGRLMVAGFIALFSLVVVSGAVGARPPVTPGSDQSHPITQVGPPASSQTHVDIFWPDGSTETVLSSQPPSTALAEQVAQQTASAEHRPAAGGGGTSTDAEDGGGGATACSWSIGGPYKLSSTEVGVNAAVSCTSDVSDVQGSLYLFRSANYTIIGADSESGGANVVWGTSGGCLSSTWQYNAELVYSFVSDENGAHYPPAHWNGPIWISC